jgi:hypothetical protein
MMISIETQQMLSDDRIERANSFLSFLRERERERERERHMSEVETRQDIISYSSEE